MLCDRMRCLRSAFAISSPIAFSPFFVDDMALRNDPARLPPMMTDAFSVLLDMLGFPIQNVLRDTRSESPFTCRFDRIITGRRSRQDGGARHLPLRQAWRARIAGNDFRGLTPCCLQMIRICFPPRSNVVATVDTGQPSRTCSAIAALRRGIDARSILGKNNCWPPNVSANSVAASKPTSFTNLMVRMIGNTGRNVDKATPPR